MAEPVPPSRWRLRPWQKWILYPLLIIPLAIPVLIVVSVAYSLLTTDKGYREGMEYAGDIKIVEHDFQEYYHGLKDYPALSLEELEAQHVLTGFAARTLKRYPHEFVPFTPATPDSAVVLTVHGYWAEPDRYTKARLTADPRAPDLLSPENPSPSASPTAHP